MNKSVLLTWFNLGVVLIIGAIHFGGPLGAALLSLGVTILFIVKLYAFLKLFEGSNSSK